MVGFVDTFDNMKDFEQKLAAKEAGPYVGRVKFTDDPLRQGRLGVNIPELTKTNNPTLDDCIWCQYLSPFYGAKSLEATSKADPSDYKLTQHSYGMWFVPPDIDTQVLVIFARGETSQTNAFWIGCVQQPLTNQQVPGYGASTFTELASDRSTGRERGITEAATGETQNYGTDFLPVGEKNRNMLENAVSPESANQFRYPVNRILADQFEAQGLIQDNIRGTTTSSAKREAPSQVFGINTPGRIREDSRELNIGPDGARVRPDREPGHTFVMDDGAVDGTNQLTRLRTASGHQLLMHDTDGVVYLANGSGKAFLEMDRDGGIHIYSAAGINLRTKQDFNLHSDRDINFHAKGGINFSSESNVALNAEGYVFSMGEKGILNSSQKGSVRNFARDGITSFTNGPQLHGASGSFHLAGSQVHFNSIGASSQWGPGWLNPDAIGIKVTGGPDGLIDIDDEKPINRGTVQKVANKTTVSEFVTHEPYDRQSSTARISKYINEAMAEIIKENPQLLPQELQDIKTQLLKQKSINSVAKQLSDVIKLNDKIKLPVNKLNTLVSNAKNLDNLIKNNIKNQAINFVQGQIASIPAVASAISAVRSFFRF